MSQSLETITREEKHTIKEVAEKSGMSESWWRQQCYQRKISFLKVGRKVLIPDSTLKMILSKAIIRPKSGKS